MNKFIFLFLIIFPCMAFSDSSITPRPINLEQPLTVPSPDIQYPVNGQICGCRCPSGMVPAYLMSLDAQFTKPRRDDGICGNIARSKGSCGGPCPCVPRAALTMPRDITEPIDPEIISENGRCYWMRESTPIDSW